MWINNEYTVLKLTCACPEESFPEIFPCIEIFFIIQDFWATLSLPWKQSLPWIHCIENIFFIIQDFWATCACPENFQAGGASSLLPPTPLAVLWSLTCAAVKRHCFKTDKCRTDAVNNLSRSIETCKMLKIVFEVKLYKIIRISDTKPKSVSTSTWQCLISNMKNYSRKTWQTSHLVLKPLRIQTLREKCGGTWHIMSPTKLRSCTCTVRAHMKKIVHF